MNGSSSDDRTMVIGGAGFLGSHLVDRLLAEGVAVDVVDDLSSGTLSNLADARRTGESLKFHHVDATSTEGLTLIGLRRPTTVYHLAVFGADGHGHLVSAEAAVAGMRSVVTVLEAAREAGVDKIVVPLPASALYGKPAVRDVPVKERPLEPRGLRGVIARAIVDALTHYREEHALEFTVLAMSSVYGPRQSSDAGVVARFVEAASAGASPQLDGGGRQTRDFLFIDDAVDALVKATDHGGGLVINIGTGEQTPIRDLWAMIAPHGPEPKLTPTRVDELLRFAVSPVRARIHLSWAPWTSLEEGIAQTITPAT